VLSLLRKIGNLVVNNTWTDCRHRNVAQTGYYSGYCRDCGTELGEGIRNPAIREDARKIRQEKGIYERPRILSRPLPSWLR
jgi:hypothetical protein